MQRILYFDCFSGISGDMTIGALLDLGLDQARLLNDLTSLGLDGYRLAISKKTVGGISATDFDVITDGHESGKAHVHRHLSDIVRIINAAGIDTAAKSLSIQIFETLARAEAAVHNLSIDQVHFHEVGAIDSIIDIVGTAICITLLQPDRILASPLHVGSGTVTCAHGVLPVPAPATLKILESVPIYATDIRGELVTPTGAAIIKNLAAEFVPLPPLTIEKTGYGTGKREFGHFNALRVISGISSLNSCTSLEYPVLLETNIDDMNPETYSYLLPLILEKGALDVYLTNVTMKKGRPGIQLSVLCRAEDTGLFETILYNETTTLGIRRQTIARSTLDRTTMTVKTPFGKVVVKAALKDGNLFRVSPEYESCKKIAARKKIPLSRVYDAARRAAQDLSKS